MSRTADEMPLFIKTFDFLLWLTQQANHFPRLHRQTITRRLLNAGLNFQEIILEANTLRGAERLQRLTEAEAELNKVRLYLRFAHRLQWLNLGQYHHASRLAAEQGDLLGGWRKITEKATSQPLAIR